MMYYRRKIALALLQKWGGELGKLDFQKLLFLYCQGQTEAEYEFVPYKFGCYSFQANADLHTLQHYGQVQELVKGNGKPDAWRKVDSADYLAVIDKTDRMSMERLYGQFRDMDTAALVRYTYQHFPYYAIRSTILNRVLTPAEIEDVRREQPSSERIGLFSIGYEGRSLENYVNALLQHDICLLCDVRKNSKSMKFGFSKNQLAHACTSVGIQFMHLPDLGIDSDKRKQLQTQEDYDSLFATYRGTTLVQQQIGVQQLAELVAKHQRVAITCFEANIHQCHRKHLAEAVGNLPGWNGEIVHICT